METEASGEETSDEAIRDENDNENENEEGEDVEE